MISEYYDFPKINIISNSQLMSFTERVGQKRVGFWCWKLFIINYFRCYEVMFC